jgi:hypothetical protein
MAACMLLNYEISSFSALLKLEGLELLAPAEATPVEKLTILPMTKKLS